MKQNTVNKSFDVTYSVVLLLIAFASIAFFVFQRTSLNILNNDFHGIYLALLAAGILFLIGAVAFHVFTVARLKKSEKGVVASALFVSDSVKNRILSPFVIRLPLLVLLVVGSVLFASGIGNAVGVPNPYSTEALSASALSSHSGLQNFVYIAFYPGFSEELVIFGGVCVTVALLLLLLSMLLSVSRLRRGLGAYLQDVLPTTLRLFKNPASFFLSALVSVGLWSLVFALAHRQAYGLNGNAMVVAFVFEFIMQLSNQLAGVFLSWIPHMAHNATIVATQNGLSVGGVTAVFGLYIPEFYHNVRDAVLEYRASISVGWSALRKEVGL